MIPQRCYIPSMEADETDQRSFNTTLSTQRYKFHCKECLLIIFFDTQLGSYAEASENITGLMVKGNLVRGNSKTGKPF